MNSEMHRFNEAVLKDADLLKEAAAASKDAKALVAFANAKGYKFTEADIKAEKGALSEKDLDKVSGGVYMNMVAGGGGHNHSDPKPAVFGW